MGKGSSASKRAAIELPLGTPKFGIVHIDPKATAIAFQEYLDVGSKLTGVSVEDISMRVIKKPEDPAKATLAELVGIGMKLFDAVVWLSSPEKDETHFNVDAGMNEADIPNMQQIARAVFYCYFMLLTQARYPSTGQEGESAKVPKFLTAIMGLNDPPGNYVRTVCSFTVQKFDPKWIRYVEFEAFGQEVLSRFGLGVAGYRMAGPFKLYEPKANILAARMPAFEFARELAKSPPTWGIHPLTRDPSVLKARGNLNANLGNLILDSFDDAQIDEMVASKILFKKPERNAAHREYLAWDPVDDISGTDYIFPRDNKS